MEILNLTLCVIECCILYFFFQHLLIPRYKTPLPVIGVAIVTALLVHFLSDINIIFKSVIFLSFLLGGSSLLYKNKPFIKTAFSMLLIYILYIIDVIFGNFFSLILDKQFLDVFYSNLTYRLVICMIIKLVDIIVISAIAHAFSKVDFNLSKRIWIMFNVVIGVFLVVTVSFIHFYSSSAKNNAEVISYSAISVSFFVMSMIVIYFFTYICSSFQQKQKLYLLETSYNTMEEKLSVQNQNTQQLQKVRHDIKNHLMNIRTLLNENNLEKANSLLNEAIGQISDISNKIDKSTGNSVIDAAVGYKATVCTNKNIAFDYEFQTLPQLNISDIDISSVISNMLDNAIEAAVQSTKPHIILKIKMHGKYLSIIVHNTYPNIVHQSEKGDLLSTKTNPSEHGYGTQIIKQIAQKYDGDSTWKITGEYFQTNVIMKNK